MHGATRSAWGLVLAITFASTAAGAAVAASPTDPTGHYDVNEILHRHGHDIQNLPTQEAAQGRPVTFNADVAATYSTNAGESHSDPVDTGYFTPALSLGVTPVTAAGWNVGGGAKLDADYYFGDYNNRFGEGRAEAFAFADRKVGPGTLTAEGIYLGFWNNAFSRHDFNLGIADLDYAVKLGPLNTDVSAEYEGSDLPEARRTRVNTTLAYTIPQKLLGHSITVEGDAAWAHFVGGTNEGRDDVIAAAVLTAERTLGRGWSLEWEGAYINRMSNRTASRFEALVLGVEIGKRF